MKPCLSFTALLLAAAVVATACGGGRNRAAGGAADATAEAAATEAKDFFVFDLEGGIANPPQATTLRDLADTIRYLPLETDEKALLPNLLAFAKMGDAMFVSGRESFMTRQQFPVYEFDAGGRFVRQITFHGRGPNEVLLTWAWFANEKLRQINIMDMAYKMVTIDVVSGEKTTAHTDWSQGADRIPLNDSTFVSVQSLSSHDDIPNTYLYFTDRAGNTLHAEERNDELLSYNARTTEYEQVPPYETYRVWPDYTGGAIFHDIFNDTLYRVRSHREITPHLLFKRGALSPRPEDKIDAGAKRKQVYINGMMESGDYVFLRYDYDDKTWQDIWSKHTGSLVLHAEGRRDLPDFNIPYELPDGRVIDLQVVYADRDNLYCVLRALDACRLLPGVKEDDNPVIVIAKLKK